MTKTAILGINGMLGSAVYQILNNEKIEVVGFNRENIDAQITKTDDIKAALNGFDYIINCIGIIKPYIHDDNPFEVERAIKVNALFPYKLSKCGAKVIQIATDCVYDGVNGNYLETDKHNPLDVYGKSKSLGEVNAENFMNLRCSIIGPEKKNNLSLLEWFRKQPKNANINGFINHQWNGITTFTFGKICKGIIQNNFWFNGLQHIVPADILNKSDMLKVFSKVFSRNDINIKETSAQENINRTILTIDKQRNKQLWDLAGYNNIPTLEYMINEINKYE